MPKGRYPEAYFHDPNISKPIEKIYDDIDAYTGEFFEDETHLHHWVNFFILIPPLFYEGQFVKGVFFSQGVDLLYKRFPLLKELFFSMAYSMWCSYPWSQAADIYLTCYDNPEHETYYRKKHPHSKKIHIPLLDTDYTNEYTIAPRYVKEKDIDVLCVARLQNLKNLPNVAEALKVYEKKYQHRLKTVFVIGKEFDLNYVGLNDDEKNELRKIQAHLIHTQDYIEFIPRAEYFSELQAIYDRAKIYTLASLFEGKNRGMYEAMLHNVPIVTYKQHNQWSRGQDFIFPGESGILCDYHPEALADAWHLILTEKPAWTPRKDVLQVSGRKHFTNRCLQSIPYFTDTIPGFLETAPFNNFWIDLAMQDNYQISYNDFIYDRNCAISNLQGLDSISNSLKFFFARFGLASP